MYVNIDLNTIVNFIEGEWKSKFVKIPFGKKKYNK